MIQEIQLNMIAYDEFKVTDSNDNLITGLVDGDFTRDLYNPSGVEVSGSITVTITELGTGKYRPSWTPNAEGPWILSVYHATYFPSGKSENYKCVTRTADIDAILADSNEIQGKLPTNYIMGSSVITDKDDEIDDIKGKTDNLPVNTATELDNIDAALLAIDNYVDTMEADIKTDIAAKHTTTDGLVTTVDGVVDSIKLDTDTMEADLKTYADGKHSTTDALITSETNGVESHVTSEHTTIKTAISTTESNIRGTDSDNLKDISDEIAALHNLSSSEVQTVIENNDLDHLIQVTAGLEKPTIGSYLDKIMNKDGLQTFDPSTDSLEVISEIVNAVLVDTDTLEADLKSYMDTKETNIIGEVDANEIKIDAVKADTAAILIDTDTMEADIKTDIAAKHTTTDGLVTTVDGVVDSIKLDTDTMEADLKTYMDTKELNIRGTDSDNLKGISDQIDGIDINTDDIETMLDDIKILMERTLGLSQENFKMSNFVRNPEGRPTSYTITTYTDSTLTVVRATYNVSTTYDGSVVSLHTVAKQ